MGFPIMIIGESGSGKSASMRSLPPESVGIINVAGKPLPFRSTGFRTLDTDSYDKVRGALLGAKTDSLIIDDAQYLMANQFMRDANKQGYQKFTDLALNFWSLVQTVIHELPRQRIVYFLMHLERDPNGNEKAKTIGRLLDEKITVEGMFTVVLKAVVKDGRYAFSTQNSGNDTVKSPIGMFDEPLIDNDLLYVDTTVRAYYGLPDLAAPKNTDASAEAAL